MKDIWFFELLDDLTHNLLVAGGLTRLRLDGIMVRWANRVGCWSSTRTTKITKEKGE